MYIAPHMNQTPIMDYIRFRINLQRLSLGQYHRVSHDFMRLITGSEIQMHLQYYEHKNIVESFAAGNEEAKEEYESIPGRFIPMNNYLRDNFHQVYTFHVQNIGNLDNHGMLSSRINDPLDNRYSSSRFGRRSG
jgi:hypothetical protein